MSRLIIITHDEFIRLDQITEMAKAVEHGKIDFKGFMARLKKTANSAETGGLFGFIAGLFIGLPFASAAPFIVIVASIFGAIGGSVSAWSEYTNPTNHAKSKQVKFD